MMMMMMVYCSCVEWNVVPAVNNAGGVVVCCHAAVQSASSVSRVDDDWRRIPRISALPPHSHCILR